MKSPLEMVRYIMAGANDGDYLSLPTATYQCRKGEIIIVTPQSALDYQKQFGGKGLTLNRTKAGKLA